MLSAFGYAVGDSVMIVAYIVGAVLILLGAVLLIGKMVDISDNLS